MSEQTAVAVFNPIGKNQSASAHEFIEYLLYALNHDNLEVNGYSVAKNRWDNGSTESVDLNLPTGKLEIRLSRNPS